jgi:hypothetical protein
MKCGERAKLQPLDESKPVSNKMSSTSLDIDSVNYNL